MADALAGVTTPLRLNRPVTRLADDVADVLRTMILRGELSAGERLLQIQLAEKLGVSRTPLREAFRQLEAEGLLRISNGNKTVEVVDVDRQSMLETYQVREVIDGLTARLAARRGLSDEERRRLESLAKRMEAASKRNPDMAQYAEAHAGFHLAILEMSGNSRLGEFGSLVRVSTQLQLTRLMLKEFGASKANLLAALSLSNAQHRQIIEALGSGDAEGAEESATKHARTVVRFLQELDTEPDLGRARGFTAG